MSKMTMLWSGESFLVLAGDDYSTFEPFQISLSNASRSFEVTINDNSLIEPTEFFDIVISGYVVTDSDQDIQHLTDQERDRVLVTNNRTRVFIIDDDGN